MQMTTDAEIQAHFDRILTTLSSLPETLVPHIVGLKVPEPKSRGGVERTTHVSGSNEAPLIVFDFIADRTRLALDVAADAIRALARLLPPPPSRSAVGGVARDVLEASTLVMWLCDPAIEPHERLERIVRLRSQDLDEERKITNAGLAKDPRRTELVDAKKYIDREIELFDTLVGSAGVEKKGMQRMTSLTGTMLDADYEYRLYSGLSHGTPIAVDSIRGMFASPDPVAGGVALSYFLHEAAHWYCRAIWALAAFMAADSMTELRQALDSVYDNLEFKEEVGSFFRAGA